jgi:DeoR/GlpR family transcriptional regulator of sugar metabolism
MLAPERRRAVLQLLNRRGRVTLAEIAGQLRISAATARRDAGELAAAGLVSRVHGGLLPPDFNLAEPAYSRKTEKAADAKARLGRAVGALLPEEGTIFIDAGTTCLEAARAVLARPGLRIYTNSIPLLALAGEASATLIGIGGEARKLSLALTGAFAQDWLDGLRFDAAVIGASGLESAGGASTTEMDEAGVKTATLRRARLRILVAHADKWNRPAAFRFAPWTSFHHLVTDKNPNRPERAVLHAAGVRLHFVASK